MDSRFTLTTYKDYPAVLDTFTGKLAPYWTTTLAKTVKESLNSNHALAETLLWL